MLSRLEEAKGELQSAQADAAERAKAQRAELEAAARGCEERQLALLANFTGKAPTLSPPVVCFFFLLYILSLLFFSPSQTCKKLGVKIFADLG